MQPRPLREMNSAINSNIRCAAPFVALGTVLAVGVAALAACGTSTTPQKPAPQKPARTTTPPRMLTATVSALGEVTLTASNGHAVTRLPSGRYTVLVTVNSSNADFHLTGPTVQRTTGAHFVGIAIWGVDLIKGTYRYENNRSGAHTSAHLISVY
jgi:hypothetical protein